MVGVAGRGARGEVSLKLKTVYMIWSCCMDGLKGKKVMSPVG